MRVDTTKRKKLEAAGWKTGSTQEFLGLSDEEAAFVELKLALSEQLRVRREQIGLSQSAFARGIGSSQSRVAKMEAGDASVSLDLLVRGLLATGATRREIGGVIARKKPAKVA
jgi:hypothetical protein